MESYFGSRRQLLTAGGLGAVAVGLGGRPSSAAAQGEVIAPSPVAQAVPVTDFMTSDQVAAARNWQATDCTEAFTQAQRASRNVWIPAGRYGLADLRLVNGASLLAAGQTIVRLDQLDSARPAINCLSDETTGQLADIHLAGFAVHGHSRARTPVVRVAARGAFAIWRSVFDFYARDCFRALEVEGRDSANVFRSSFKVTAEGTRDIAVLVTGGVYNDFDLFMSRCDSWALDDSSTSSTIRAVAENCMIFRGQNNQVSARLEEISSRPANDAAIEDRGFGNLYLTPTVVLTGSARLAYAIRPFSHSVFINPQILASEGAIEHPFAPNIDSPFTVIGGRNGTGQAIAAAFDGTSAARDARLAKVVGDPREFVTGRDDN